MIVDETLVIRVGNKGALEYYKKLLNNPNLKTNDIIVVNSKDIYPESHIRVKRVCERCLETKIIKRCEVTRYCNKCAREVYNMNYIKKSYTCIDCGKPKSTNGKRCKDCAKKYIGVKKRLDINVYKNKLESKNFEILSEFKTTRDRVKLKCKKCGYVYEPIVNNIANKGKGCPKCTIPRGESHPNWKGGVRVQRKYRDCIDIEHRIWSKKVKERDNYTCRACNRRYVELQSHHILSYKNYPDKRYDINNGVTLCTKCHIEFHKTYGYFNFDFIDLINFINNKQRR